MHSLRNAYIKVQVCKQATFFNLKPCLENCSLTACVEVKAQDQWRPVGLDSMEPFITAKWFYIYRSNMDVSTCTEPECVLQEKTNTFNVNVAVCSGWHNFTTLLLTVWGWGGIFIQWFLISPVQFSLLQFHKWATATFSQWRLRPLHQVPEQERKNIGFNGKLWLKVSMWTEYCSPWQHHPRYFGAYCEPSPESRHKYQHKHFQHQTL